MPDTSELITTSDYLRSHEALLVRLDMSEYLIDYYQHRALFAPDTTSQQDENLKDLIACFAIHLTVRATLETHAWTVHAAEADPYSLFVTGSTGEIDGSGMAHGFLVGNVLTENIRHSDTYAIHAQAISLGKTFNSYVPFDTLNVSAMVEKYYDQSEQRPLRIKLSSSSDTAIGLAGLSGHDPEWFKAVDLDALSSTVETFDSTRMRRCGFAFTCNCSPAKLLPFFKAFSREELTDLYGVDNELIITCPRCGRKFAIDKKEFEVLN